MLGIKQAQSWRQEAAWLLASLLGASLPLPLCAHLCGYSPLKDPWCGGCRALPVLFYGPVPHLDSGTCSPHQFQESRPPATRSLLFLISGGYRVFGPDTPAGLTTWLSSRERRVGEGCS